MTLEELIKLKLKRLDSVPDNLVTAVDRNQRKVYSEVISLLDTLEKKDGAILLTEKNIAKVGEIVNRLKEAFFSEQYRQALVIFASEFDTQAKITDQLFKAGFDDIPNEAIYKTILKVSKTNAIELFGEAFTDQAFFKPLKDQLLKAVTNQATFKDTVDALRLITLGDDKSDGLIQSHAKTYARTSFSIADRNYTTTVASSFNIEWYRYSGSEIETTRLFCQTRHDHYYCRKQIEEWGTLEPWAGWMKGTNPQTIFTNLGGWNCRHSLIPVSVFKVPKAVVLKAVTDGDYKPDKAVKEWLGI